MIYAFLFFLSAYADTCPKRMPSLQALKGLRVCRELDYEICVADGIDIDHLVISVDAHLVNEYRALPRASLECLHVWRMASCSKFFPRSSPGHVCQSTLDALEKLCPRVVSEKFKGAPSPPDVCVDFSDSAGMECRKKKGSVRAPLPQASLGKTTLTSSTERPFTYSQIFFISMIYGMIASPAIIKRLFAALSSF